MTDTLPTAALSDLGPDEGTQIRSPRAPQQHRGQRRFEQLLDAAEALIIEQGLEALTTNAVAERAESSVGSLYHFFPGGKEAIVEGLAVRYLTRMRDINAEALARLASVQVSWYPVRRVSRTTWIPQRSIAPPL